MDDLVKEFIEETVENIAEIDFDLVKLEQDPENKELLGKIFRLMHTIKGTCGFLGLSRLEKTAHAAENLLDLFRSGQMKVSATAMTALFSSIDRVRHLVAEIAATGSEPEGNDQDIISRIELEISQGTDAESAGTSPGAESNGENLDEHQDLSKSIQNSAAQEKHESADENESLDDLELLFEKNTNNQSKSKQTLLDAEKPDATQSDNGEMNAEMSVKKNAEKVPAENSNVERNEKGSEFLKVQMSVLEDLINMVSELVLTRNQILQLIKIDEDSIISASLQRLNRITSDLQEGVMKTRMQPIGNAWSKLPRVVRDLSMELNKKISLEMSGEDTELDRQVLEMIRDPLTHMIRNSCDHGIESPNDRKAANKPETGTIKLKAFHEGGFIIIEITDDGKGLDAMKIGKKALDKGLITSDQLNAMTDKQILLTIFKPGFSMAQQITSVSGRGVGMDVVRTNIEKIGGTIDIKSTLGAGTGFYIKIPLTLAIISVLIIEIDGLRYAVPQLNIQELVQAHASDEGKIEKINNRPVFRRRDRIIPLIDSQTLFDGFVNNNKLENAAGKFDIGDKLIVVINAGASYFGLVVDAIHDMEEIVIKSISSVLQNTKIFAGNTILGDGEVIMLLDPAAIARRFEVNNDVCSADENATGLGKNLSFSIGEQASMLIFKAGKATPKAIPIALVSRLQRFGRDEVTFSGDQYVVKYNDHLLPLYMAEAGMALPDSDEIITLILADDRSHAAIGLVVETVLDIVEDVLDLTTSTARAGIIGSVRLSGRTVDVIDIAHYLGQSKEDFFSLQHHSAVPFNTSAENANGASHSNHKGQIRVLVIDDSAFFRNMLKPILVSSGFHVTICEDPIAAIKLHDSGLMFDIILSDIEMPNMTGYEFVEKMKRDSNWKDLPFIAISSHTTAQDVEHGYLMGFSKYIGKFDKDELLRTIGNVLSH